MPTLAPAAPCPICRRPAEERFKPFCSARCRDIDLHRWMAGVYAIPAKPDDEEDGEDGAAPRRDDPEPG
ncbi:MAG TPA: DNA gyrase inhibitor YacG [Xanthobacteraceae bacterium]|nr:DNA gyrase inhibitor YacG [Xanthobacteraceae bacterium]